MARATRMDFGPGRFWPVECIPLVDSICKDDISLVASCWSWMENHTQFHSIWLHFCIMLECWMSWPELDGILVQVDLSWQKTLSWAFCQDDINFITWLLVLDREPHLISRYLTRSLYNVIARTRQDLGFSRLRLVEDFKLITFEKMILTSELGVGLGWKTDIGNIFWPNRSTLKTSISYAMEGKILLFCPHT
jgi:hypothetical protein